jgi:hypothetical protein
VLGFVITLIASLFALGASYLSVVSRAEGVRKSRAGLSKSEIMGEAMQDRAAWLGFLATGLVFLGLGVTPDNQIAQLFFTWAPWVIVGLFVAGLIHILYLMSSASSPEPSVHRTAKREHAEH